MMAEMNSFYHDGPSFTNDCEVIFRERAIVVSYNEDENGRQVGVVYTGTEVRDGQWTLECAANKGRGTLSRSPANAITLEGSWVERGYMGMWSIDLEEQD